MLKKYIGDKKFYKTVLAVALPIMLQNGITNFVSLLDNIMVGQEGKLQMSGVAIVNQLIFIFNLAIFGAVSGAGIFTSQFHGKGDEEGIRQTLRFKYIVCTVIAVAAIAIFAFFGEPLIKLFLRTEGEVFDPDLAAREMAETLGYGKQYLAVMLIGLIPFAISQALSGTMRETEHTVSPMVAGLIAVAVNCIGNYILIFGNFGAPKLGVVGAAIATVASRFCGSRHSYSIHMRKKSCISVVQRSGVASFQNRKNAVCQHNETRISAVYQRNAVVARHERACNVLQLARAGRSVRL